MYVTGPGRRVKHRPSRTIHQVASHISSGNASAAKQHVHSTDAPYVLVGRHRVSRELEGRSQETRIDFEKKVKKVEKSLEIRVRYKLTRLSILHSDLRYMIETRLGRGREQNITCSTEAPKS